MIIVGYGVTVDRHRPRLLYIAPRFRGERAVCAQAAAHARYNDAEYRLPGVNKIEMKWLLMGEEHYSSIAGFREPLDFITTMRGKQTINFHGRDRVRIYFAC